MQKLLFCLKSTCNLYYLPHPPVESFFNEMSDIVVNLLIFQKGIDENWEAALEHNPEAFARVVCFTLRIFPLFCHSPERVFSYSNVLVYVVLINHRFFYLCQVMLYVDMEVNGVPLKVCLSRY